MSEPAHEYAPFWRRFVASFIDGLVVAQLCAPWSFGWTMSDAMLVAAYVSIGVTRVAYEPILHAYWGRTIGKRVMGMELRTVAGDRIGWRHALRRSSIDLLFTIVHLALVLSAWQRSGLPLPDGIDPANVGKVLLPVNNVLTWVASIWFFGELATMFTNPQRRALHDLIGGTIVVVRTEDDR